MDENKLWLSVSVDRDSLLGRVAAIEKMADNLKYEASRLRHAMSCSQVVNEEKPEA